MPLNSVYPARVSHSPAGSIANNLWEDCYGHQWNFLTGDDFWADDLTQTSFLIPQPDPSVSLLDATAASTSSSTTSSTDVVYLQQPGDPTAININDVNQGQIGDCFLLASIAELALHDPDAIMNMIHVNADGTETVTLYTNSDGSLVNISTYQSPSSTATFRADSVTVNNTFPSDAVNNDQPPVNGQTEIWVQVLEEAVATLYSAGGADSVGYALLNNGGFSLGATEVLTGLPGSSTIDPTITAAQLTSDEAAGDLITISTTETASTTLDLVENHEYAFEGITTVNGIPMVQLYNPWGNPASYWVPGSPYTATASTPGALPYQPSLIPLASLLTYLDTLSGDYGAITISPPPPTPTPSEANFSVQDTTTGLTNREAGTAYSGPVAGLTSEIIYPTTDQVTITAEVPNVFIQVGIQGQTNPPIAGINVAQSNGNNVLDSYANSSFLTDGSGTDQNYLDIRALTQNMWSTMVNFHSGDNITVWGVTPQDSTLDWIGDTEGASGATGLTGVFVSTTAGQPEAAVTLAGFKMADVTDGKLAITYDTIGGTPYASIHVS